MDALPVESHPADGFVTLRLSARLRVDARDGHDDDDAPTRLQHLELCFHEDLADEQPLSLHFCGSPRRVVQYTPPDELHLPRPSPPCHIYEMDDIIDLSATARPESDDEPARRRPPSLILGVVAAFLVGFLISLASGLLFPTTSYSSATTSPSSSVTAPDGRVYKLRFAETTTRPIDLHRIVVPLEKLRQSLAEPVYEALTAAAAIYPPELGRTLTSACDDVFSLLVRLGHWQVPSEASRDLSFTCLHLQTRWPNIVTNWIVLRNTSTAVRRFGPSTPGTEDKLDGAMLFLRDILDEAWDASSLVRAYRRVYHLSRYMHSAWGVSPCVLCSDDEGRPAGELGWHFACQSSFASLLDEFPYEASVPDVNFIPSLATWARHQSARRYSALHKAVSSAGSRSFWEVAYGVLGDDVVHEDVGSEGALVALVRHMAEFSQGVDELLARLSRQRLLVPLDAAPGEKPRGWLANMWATPPSRPPPHVVQENLRQGIDELAHVRDSVLHPLLHTLATVLANAMRGCRMHAELHQLLEELDQGRGWETVTSTAVFDGNQDQGGDQGPGPVVFDISRTVLVPNVTREVEALQAAFDEYGDELRAMRARQAEREAQFDAESRRRRAREVREWPTPQNEEEAHLFRSAEESIDNRFGAQGLRDAATKVTVLTATTTEVHA